MSNREHVHRLAEEALDRVAPTPTWHVPAIEEPEEPGAEDGIRVPWDGVGRFLESATLALVAVPVAVAVAMMGAVVA